MTPAIATGCSISIHLCGSSGRDWNTTTQVSRYSDSGSTQSSGAAATSVEMCAVTAMRSPEGTAARKIQRSRVTTSGAGALASSVRASTTASFGERNNSTPQAAIRRINRP